MLSNSTTTRVIYADTDNMGVAYHANYLRWFEIGRSEMFRSWGLTYKQIESKGILMPVTEVLCRYFMPAQYDDELNIHTTIDTTLRAGMKFNYTISVKEHKKPLAEGYTKHAFLNENGKVVRPPKFITDIIKERSSVN